MAQKGPKEHEKWTKSREERSCISESVKPPHQASIIALFSHLAVLLAVWVGFELGIRQSVGPQMFLRRMFFPVNKSPDIPDFADGGMKAAAA